MNFSELKTKFEARQAIPFIDKLIQSAGWKESFIGLYENEAFNFVLDTNTGGCKVEDLDGNFVSYLSEDHSPAEAGAFVQKLMAVENRADQPF